ncbi:hypothetical protein GCM10027167_62220 [Nocardia heshunensis]
MPPLPSSDCNSYGPNLLPARDGGASTPSNLQLIGREADWNPRPTPLGGGFSRCHYAVVKRKDDGRRTVA